MSGEQTNSHGLCGLPEDAGTTAEVLSGILVCTWGLFFPPQRALECTQKQPPFKSRCKTRLLLCPQSPLGELRQPRFSPCLRYCRLPLPSGASCPGKRERKGERSQRTSPGNNKTTLRACLCLSGALLPVPRRGGHWSFTSTYSHCTCLLLPCLQVWLAKLCLRAKDVTESIRFQ